MRYIIVDLYRDFQCSAHACPNTCCARWDVFIDEETHEKMVEKEEELGVPAKDWLFKKDGYTFVKLDQERCPMLDEQNLCRVVLKLGPQYLSQTCKLYPRIFKAYGDTMEIHLNMSCPEVVLRLMEKESVEFDFAEDDEAAAEEPNKELYLFESEVRASMVEVIQDMPGISLNTRLFAAFTILEEAIAMCESDQMDTDGFRMKVNAYVQAPVLAAIDGQVTGAVDEEKRYRFLQRILAIAGRYREQDRFFELVQHAAAYFSQGYSDRYLSDFKRFREEVLKAYDGFYTNYWVYRIFSDTLSLPEYEKAKEKFIYIAVEFALFQMIAMVSFVEGRFTQEEYACIISCLSRLTEHNPRFYKDLISEIHKNNLANTAGLLLLTIV